MKTQYITDENGKKVSVIIPIAEYERLRERLEERHDIRQYDRVKAANEPRITLDAYIKGKRRRKRG